MKKIIIFLLFIVLFACKGNDTNRITLNDKYFIEYNFTKKPSIGNTALKISVFDKSDKITTLEIVGHYFMPSMRMHHNFTGTIKSNKNSDYIFPINFSMPGEWEIVLEFRENGTVIYTETIKLKI